MCGIAGLVAVDAESAAAGAGALAALAHRGPDGEGWLAWRPGRMDFGRGRPAPGAVENAQVLLLHRRLAVLDLSAAAAQPLRSSDGRYAIVVNGELYNYLELRAELEGLGHLFNSRSDSEVLLAAWIQWGREALARLTGMFAFAVLDMRTGHMVLARDFAGIKPLYYAHWAGGLAFASEPKALLGLPGFPRRVHPQRLYDYLVHGRSDHGGETLFAAVRQLPAASILEAPAGELPLAAPLRYWRPDLERRLVLPASQAAEGLRERLLENVRLHLRSDVPVGVALSGGMDSAALLAAARKVQGPGAELQAFHYADADPAVSEERWAELAGASAGARVHKVRAGPEDLAGALDELILAQDEPFGSTSIFAQYCVFRAARRAGLKVMLDGQGADELFGGYRIFLGARLAGLLRRGRWREAASFARAAAALPGVRRSALWRHGAGLALHARWRASARRLTGSARPPRWLRMEWFRARRVETSPPPEPAGPELLRGLLAQSLLETSLPMLLRYEDRNSMAHSVESRVPFLTRELVEFALALPEELLIAGDATSKAVFRLALRGLVPDRILDRRDKIGFATGERGWLLALSPWVERLLRDEAARLPVLNPGSLPAEWEAVRRAPERFDFRIWRWLNLSRWAALTKARFD